MNEIGSLLSGSVWSREKGTTQLAEDEDKKKSLDWERWVRPCRQCRVSAGTVKMRVLRAEGTQNKTPLKVPQSIQEKHPLRSVWWVPAHRVFNLTRQVNWISAMCSQGLFHLSHQEQPCTILHSLARQALPTPSNALKLTNSFLCSRLFSETTPCCWCGL